MRKPKFLIMICAFLLLVSGCTAKTPEEALTDAYNETKKVNSLEMTLNVEAAVEAGDLSISVKGNANAKAKFDNEDFQSHLNMNMNLGTEKLDIQAYVQKNKNQLIGYAEEDGEWSKFEATLEDINLEEMPTLDFKFDEVKELSKEKGETVYQALIKKTTLEKAIEEIKNKAKEEDETINFDDFKFEINDVVVKFTVKDKLITRVELELPFSFEVKMEEVMKYNITLKLNGVLTNHNNVQDIVVPEDVLIQAQVNELKQYASTYAELVKLDIMMNNLKGVYTNTELKELSFSAEEDPATYDGPKPSKVELKLNNDYNLSGVIEMDGYVATFEDDEMISFDKK